VDAVHRTYLDARIVLLANARLGDDVGHSKLFSWVDFAVPDGIFGPAKRERTF
jgi:hypothetical protein